MLQMKLSLLDRVHRRLEFEKALEVLEEKYERNGGGEKGKDTPAGLSTD